MDSFLLNSSHGTKTGEYTRDGWTFEENKLFEKEIVNFEDSGSLAFFEHVARLMPWKTIESIKNHHQDLVEDLKIIESSDIHFEDIVEEGIEMEVEAREEIPRPKKKGIPWTEDEHKLFLMGLKEFGKGEWKNISKYYVTTKTPTQIASHAQKFEKRMHTKTPPERRRPSINDIELGSEPSFSLNPSFPSDPPGFQPNPFGNVTTYNHVHNNY